MAKHTVRRDQDDEDENEVVVIERDGSPVVPFLWGLGVGAALALIFAPMSGRELRDTMRERGEKLKDLAIDKGNELEELVQDGYEKARSRVEHGIEGAQRKVREGKKVASDVAGAGKAAAVTAREELERRLADAREARRAGRASGEEEPVA